MRSQPARTPVARQGDSLQADLKPFVPFALVAVPLLGCLIMGVVAKKPTGASREAIERSYVDRNEPGNIDDPALELSDADAQMIYLQFRNEPGITGPEDVKAKTRAVLLACRSLRARSAR